MVTCLTLALWSLLLLWDTGWHERGLLFTGKAVLNGLFLKQRINPFTGSFPSLIKLNLLWFNCVMVQDYDGVQSYQPWFLNLVKNHLYSYLFNATLQCNFKGV